MKKIGKFEYYTRSKVSVKADIKIGTRNGEIVGTFYLDIPEYDISLKNHDVNILQSEAKKLLEERTSIKWKNYLHIKLEGKTTADLGHYHPMVKINLEVKPFQQGTNVNGKVMNTLNGNRDEVDILARCGFHEETKNHKGEVWGFNPDDSFNGIFFFGCDRLETVIEDTEENRASIKKVVDDFEIMLQRLYVMFNQNNIHKTLAGNLNFLTAPAPTKLLTPKPECQTCLGTGDISLANEPLKDCPDCTREVKDDEN